MTDIIDLVREDHRGIGQPFDKLQAPKGAEDRSSLFAQVKEKLEREL